MAYPNWYDFTIHEQNFCRVEDSKISFAVESFKGSTNLSCKLRKRSLESIPKVMRICWQSKSLKSGKYFLNSLHYYCNWFCTNLQISVISFFCSKAKLSLMFSKNSYRSHIIFFFHKINFNRNVFNLSVKIMMEAELPYDNTGMLICKRKKQSLYYPHFWGWWDCYLNTVVEVRL